MALVDASARSATATAVEDTKLAVIDKHRFLFLVGETPDLRAAGDGQPGRAPAGAQAGGLRLDSVEPDGLRRPALHHGVEQLADPFDG